MELTLADTAHAGDCPTHGPIPISQTVTVLMGGVTDGRYCQRCFADLIAAQCHKFANSEKADAMTKESDKPMNELNPNHPVTQEIHDHWHKLCAMVMFKLGVRELVITSDDISAFAAEYPFPGGIAVKPTGDKMRLFLVGPGEAARLARQEGGLPS